jgi:hypothetical protein
VDPGAAGRVESSKRIAAPKDGGLTLRAGNSANKDRPEAVRYARHPLSWQFPRGGRGCADNIGR